MSPLLEMLLFGKLDGLEPEMRPERVFGAVLASMTFGVRVFSKALQAAGSSPSLAPACEQTQRIASVVSGTLTVAQARQFLLWLADSLDTDTPAVQIEVVSDDGNAKTVQEPARRLAAQAFA